MKFYVDMHWSSPRYHENRDQRKNRLVFIIFAHRWFFRALISATSLEE
jgi:hypothetical protein